MRSACHSLLLDRDRASRELASCWACSGTFEAAGWAAMAGDAG